MRENEGTWDVFISHASEDKESFARPLAEILRARGLNVWFDEYTLTVGDSLRRSIDRGLTNSSYGIVILSPNFFAKEWPQKELDGLTSKEVSGGKVILPIWHNISADQIRKYSPTLADRVALTSNRGLENVVTELLRVIKKPDSERVIPKPTVAPPVWRRLLKRLKWREIVSFIGFIVLVLSCIAAWLALPQIQNFLAGSNTLGIISSATLTLMPPDISTTPTLPTQESLRTSPTITLTSTSLSTVASTAPTSGLVTATPRPSSTFTAVPILPISGTWVGDGIRFEIEGDDVLFLSVDLACDHKINQIFSPGELKIKNNRFEFDRRMAPLFDSTLEFEVNISFMSITTAEANWSISKGSCNRKSQTVVSLQTE